VLVGAQFMDNRTRQEEALHIRQSLDELSKVGCHRDRVAFAQVEDFFFQIYR
jgi:hypothetical protein